MKKSFLFMMSTMAFSLLATSPLQARGRHPEPEDGYPDYNKFEIRRKPKDASNEDGRAKAMDAPPPALPSSPSQSAPGKWVPEDDTIPKAPPKPVFMPDDASEPPLPDAIKDTLIQGTTLQ